MSKRVSFFLLCFILSFHSLGQSSEKIDKVNVENWIEDIPILNSLVEKKRDVVEFDSSNGKIISISFDSKSLSKNQIFSFYKVFFEDKKWKKYKDKNVWETKSKRFKKKIFKIENMNNNNLIIKIIVENF